MNHSMNPMMYPAMNSAIVNPAMANPAMVNPSMNIPKDDSEEEFMINPIFKIINNNIQSNYQTNMYPAMNSTVVNPAMVNPSMNSPKDDSKEKFMINPSYKILNNNIQSNYQTNNMKLNYPIPNNYQKDFPVSFLLIDKEKDKVYTCHLIIMGNNNMTIEKLIKNFSILLCDDEIFHSIRQYLLNDTIELDPHSKQKLIELGINDKSIIKAIK